MPERDRLDPKGLIREAYLIEGIGPSECRSIFLDWALSVPEGADAKAMVTELLSRHQNQPAGHPMTAVLHAALGDAAPRRRGGRGGRLIG